MGRKIPIQTESDEETAPRGDNDDMKDNDKTKQETATAEVKAEVKEKSAQEPAAATAEKKESPEEAAKAADAYAKSAADAYARATAAAGAKQATAKEEAPAGEGDDIPDYETPEYCERPAGADAKTDLPDDSADLKALLKNRDEKIEDLQAKSCEYLDSLQRLKAEFENFRKRSRREKADTVKYANEKLLLSLLPVLDNMKRGTAFAEKSAAGDSDNEILKGIKMVQRQLEDLLADNGVTCFESEGTEFDPNLHESLYAVENPDVAPNTVIEEIEPGYMFNEKVLRVAKVAVSREA